MASHVKRELTTNQTRKGIGLDEAGRYERIEKLDAYMKTLEEGVHQRLSLSTFIDNARMLTVQMQQSQANAESIRNSVAQSSRDIQQTVQAGVGVVRSDIAALGDIVLGVQSMLAVQSPAVANAPQAAPIAVLDQPPTMADESEPTKASEDKPPTMADESESEKASEDKPPTMADESEPEKASEDKPSTMADE
eukprot:2969076-Karenia_brevis.AAC.1